jgi:hypothetical protein
MIAEADRRHRIVVGETVSVGIHERGELRVL